jgi:flagellar FliL protein
MSEAAEKPKDGAHAAPAAAAAPKGDKLGLLVLLLALLNTGAVAGMGFLFLQVLGRITHMEDQTKALETKLAEEKKPPKSAVGKEFIPQELGVLYPLDAFLVNITSDRGSRFLQMKLEMELDAPALEDEIALKRPAIRDAIIVLLTSRNYAELRDPKGMRKLRVDLVRAVNNLLKSGQVKEIYFTQFNFN